MLLLHFAMQGEEACRATRRRAAQHTTGAAGLGGGCCLSVGHTCMHCVLASTGQCGLRDSVNGWLGPGVGWSAMTMMSHGCMGGIGWVPESNVKGTDRCGKCDTQCSGCWQFVPLGWAVWPVLLQPVGILVCACELCEPCEGLKLSLLPVVSLVPGV